MMLSAIEVLEQARAIFQNHGGAQGVYRDGQGRVCAMGALEELIQHSSSWNMIADLNARNLLNKSAHELFDFADAVAVNDTLGYQAVLEVYDHAIKTLSGK